MRVIASAVLPPVVAGKRRMILTPPSHLLLFPGEDVRPLREPSLYALFRAADAEGIGEILIYAPPGEVNAGLLDRIRKAAEP